MRVLAVVSLLWVTGCLQSGTTVCGGGRTCPAGTSCHDDLGLCLYPEQLTACAGLDDGASCAFGDRPNTVCAAGVCIEQHCGDGLITGSEDCDGLALPADVTCKNRGFHEPRALACNADCTFDVTQCGPRCGDGMLEVGKEDCDLTTFGERTTCPQLGYYNPGPLGCTSFCTFDVSMCHGRCGDGTKDPQETCEGAPPETGSCIDYGHDAGVLECSPFCFPSLDRCASIGWRVEATASNQNLYGVWGTGPNHLYAVGEAGVVQHYNGTSWTKLTVPTTRTLYDVWTDGPTNAWVVGYQGTILRWNGSVWSLDATSGATTEDLVGIWGTSSTDLWVVARTGTKRLLRRDGNGWSDRTPSGAPPLHGVWGSASNDVWAVGDNGAIYHYDGQTWMLKQQTPGTTLYGVGGSGKNDVWAVGTDGTHVVILHFNGAAWTTITRAPASGAPALASGRMIEVFAASPYDAVAVAEGSDRLFHWDGRAWTPQRSPTSTGHYDVWGSSANEVIVVGEYSNTLRYGGSAWTVGLTPAGGGANWVYAMWGTSQDDLWAVGLSGMIIHRDRIGWTVDPASGGASYSAIWGSAKNDIHLVDDQGYVRHWNGTSWSTKTALPGNPYITSMWGSGPHEIWAVGAGGKLLHYDGAWSEVTPVTNVMLGSIWGSARDDIWAIGEAGTVLHYNGAMWTASTLPTTEGLRGIWGSGPDDVLVIGPAGTNYRWNGSTWNPEPSPTPGLLDAVYGLGPDDVFATGTAGTLFHYNGERWGPIRTPFVSAYFLPWATPRSITFAGVNAEYIMLDRSLSWSCSAREVNCGDQADNDCDGTIDNADSDCRATLALSEVHAGTVDYVEVVNRDASLTANLYGVTLTYRGSCDASPRALSFQLDALVPPQGVMRASDDIDDVRAHERYADGDSCDEPRGAGWYALCAGACDLSTCSNVIDYVERSVGGAAPPGRPACAIFGTPIDVASEPASGDTPNSLVRTKFDGIPSDWSLGAMSRN